MKEKSRKIREAGNREAVLLTNDYIKVVIDADKGMVPELSTKYKDGWINAHWQPWFRANSGESWNEEKHAPFWKVPLLYDIAGNFPCVPNFGPDNTVGTYELPPHGYTALNKWEQETPRSDSETVSFASTLGEGDHPFRYKKTDMLITGHNILYTKLNIKNTGSKSEPYNCGWHNTVGSPFLESGCLIDNNAEKFAIPPKGTEFDTTGQLAFGEVIDNLESAPLRQGGTINLREVPGITGFTDFITGAVPSECYLGWASVVNPRLKLVYLSFFTGPAAIKKDEIPLYFYDLWMNYGGRPFEPWAAVDGITDHTFCLGAENTTAFYANGLSEAIKNPELLGNPTVLELEADDEKTLYYGTMFQSYEGIKLDKGVRSIEAKEGEMIIHGYSGESISVKCDYQFNNLKGL